MAKPDTWMPFYIGDYMGDTGRLSTEQHGAYLLLIFDYWRNGPPPDDDDELAQITKLGLDGWRRNRAKIERFFRVVDGQWRHKRIDEEMSSAQANADKASERASAAAQKRWNRQDAPSNAPGNAPSNAPSNAPGNAPGNAPSNARAMLEECPSPSPSPLRTVSNETGAVAPPEDRLAELRSLPVAKGSWRLALLVLTERGSMAEGQARSFVGKIKGLGLTDDELWAIAEDAWKAGTLDPKAYLMAAAEAVAQRRAGQVGIVGASERQQRAWMEEWRDRGPTSWKIHERGPRPGAEGCRVSPDILAEFGLGAEVAA